MADNDPITVGELIRIPSSRKRITFIYSGLSLAVPERVLEQDPQGVGETLRAFEPEDLVAAPACAESRRGAHPTDCMEPPALPI